MRTCTNCGRTYDHTIFLDSCPHSLMKQIMWKEVRELILRGSVQQFDLDRIKNRYFTDPATPDLPGKSEGTDAFPATS